MTYAVNDVCAVFYEEHGYWYRAIINAYVEDKVNRHTNVVLRDYSLKLFASKRACKELTRTPKYLKFIQFIILSCNVHG